MKEGRSLGFSYLAVGGAGSLEGKLKLRVVIDTSEFPVPWKGTAQATADALQLLQRDHQLEWTFLSPAAMVQSGTRTGTFRLGTDKLIVAPDDQSTISLEDYALAMIDEMENPRHIRRRFTVGY